MTYRMAYSQELLAHNADEAELLRERAKAAAIAEIRAILIDLRNACAEAEDEGYITADEAAGIADVCAEWSV